ncbi:hypothetical protein BD309DRAFT_263514 [Dichomitus squalens]|uniref:Uncharacterized protein n=1 Tax=Dichomitus squalens TaxID=114155 RepID=A0A4Q9P3G4_9APHY|nr:hypothetical protein BD309DRAFT_263514 [Dichomitus squalens]TBU59686.1 hypothetical protein BD310DRAFT_378945 [Dichomitus squalens]
MSAQPLPQLCQGAPDLDADSDYLGTPVDPPSSCQPYVADYEPVVGYYQRPEGYESPEYAGHVGTPYAHHGDSRCIGTSAQYDLSLQPTVQICNQADTSIAVYQYMSSGHPETYQMDDSIPPYAPRAQGVSCSIPTSTLPLPRGASGVPLHCTPRSLQYPEHEGGPDSSDEVGVVPQLSKPRLHQPGLTCDTSVTP